MRDFCYMVLLMLVGTVVSGQEKTVWQLKLDQVDVKSKRKFQDIGTTKTNIDSVVLRESITNSLADILSQNTSIFIKNYGRGTLATASFRGTAPSHTQVLWNGMKINSPMLGQVDFSMIPSYLIDDMSLWHGASSVNVTGGGLGGAVTLASKPAKTEGFKAQFIQGIGSFRTYDEFLQLRYGKKKWEGATRLAYTNSRNDFSYVNYNKKEFGEDGRFNHYPLEKNKNCSFRDLHLLQEFYYDHGNGNRFSLSGWFINSKRGLPMLNVNYREEDLSRNEQDQITFRAVAGWDRNREKWKLAVKAGYTFDNMLYTYRGEVGSGELAEMMHSNSIVYTGFTNLSTEYFLSEKLMFSANATFNYQSVSSYDKIERNGYEKQRPEVSLFAGVRYRPLPMLGMALNIREECYGGDPGRWRATPVIPAAFVDVTIWPRYGVILKSSVTRNHHAPTLNDLYFLPGGNPDLKDEKGFTYDGGVEFTLRQGEYFRFSGEVTGYDSRIRDWIVWIPTFKGFWEPHNVKEVHSYGWELKGNTEITLNKWKLYLNANWAQTRSINHGDPQNWADESIGKQLVYIPEFSSSVMGKLSWKLFTLTYKYNYFSERFTTSSNDMNTKIGRLGSYYMNDVSIAKDFRVKAVGCSLKFSVYNLFNEEYVSVLSRPMPGRNYSIFIGIKI